MKTKIDKSSSQDKDSGRVLLLLAIVIGGLGVGISALASDPHWCAGENGTWYPGNCAQKGDDYQNCTPTSCKKNSDCAGQAVHTNYYEVYNCSGWSEEYFCCNNCDGGYTGKHRTQNAPCNCVSGACTAGDYGNWSSWSTGPDSTCDPDAD